MAIDIDKLEALKNKAFMTDMCCATTAEDIQNVFACYGVRFTIEEAREILRNLKYNDGSELSVEDLDSVNGGGPVLLIGAAIYALALTVAHRHVAKTKFRRHF